MTMRLRWLLPTATTLGLGLLIAALLLNEVVSEWNIRRLVENERREVHTQRVLTTLEEVLARMTEAETAERGFLITAEARYLEPYQKAVAQAWQTLEQLRSLTEDDPSQQARIGPLQERVEARLGELRQAIAAQWAGGFDASRKSVSTNHGRRLMNEMRSLVAEMKEHEGQALAVRAAQSRRSAAVTTWTGRVATLLGMGLVGLAFALIRRDLALRQKAEAATRQLAAIVESSQDAIIGETLDGVIMSWNAAAQRLFGYTAAEAINQPITLLYPPGQAGEVGVKLDRLRREVPIEHFETSRIHKDGRRIDVSLSLSPIRDGGGQVVGVSAIARDITEQKTLQREVLEIAAREQRRIGQDLHDGLGQELTGLAMLAQRLAGLLADRALPEAGSAEKIARGLEQALNHVRALSRGLVPVEVDAEGLRVALEELAQRTSELNGITCTFRPDQPISLLDNQAATHLYRMSQEAVTNAIKHGRARHVDIRLKTAGSLATLEIRDDGVGFAEAVEEATGSGLRIMRYRAALIGARLSIEPAEPSGTVVRCTLRSAG